VTATFASLTRVVLTVEGTVASDARWAYGGAAGGAENAQARSGHCG
jgi:hypothetical protein